MECGACGHANPEAARFCNACGAPLAQPGTPREERKIVSIVFADLAGSTALAERSDPEDVRAALEAHYRRVRSDLERYGGTVEKFIGDAVMAVFGAPVVHEDDAERAVRAALAIRDAAAEADVQLRVAVNTGEALVRLDARPGEGQSMAAGDVVNTAARIQSAAPVNGVLVGEATHRATSHVIEYRPSPPITAKGKAEPVRVWEAVAARSRIVNPEAMAARAPLVGRDREVDVLRDTLARARTAREPQLLTLVGAPGIGKSRLVAELFGMIESDPELVVWRHGRCLSYGEGVSYWALAEIVKAEAGILESDPAEVAEEKLRTAVSTRVPDPGEAAWIVRHARQLIGLEASAAGGDGRGETFAAWRQLLEAIADRQLAVLVFEDVHWADDGLLDFIDDVAERATGVPLVILCTARPELLARRPGWGGGKANAATLSLSALTSDEASELVGHLVGDAALPADLHEALLHRADGNPLFAEEYIRMLRDRGDLDDGRRESAVAVGEGQLPDTVQGIIAARLDALAADEKTLLQAGSVMGHALWLGSVVSMTGITRWEAEERLHALERKEMVRRERRTSVAGETEYHFRHVLIRDVAYGQIPRPRRAELHLRAAAWIESLPADRATDRAELLAHHYGEALALTRAAGGDTAPMEPAARAALREAGRRAAALNAFPSAIGFYERARELWPRDDPDYARLLFDLGSMLFWGRNEGGPELEEAARLLADAGDVEAAGEAHSRRAYLAWITGDRSVASSHYARSIELIDGLPDTRTTATIRAAAYGHDFMRGIPVAIDDGYRILDVLERLGSEEDQLNMQLTLALAHMHVPHSMPRVRALTEAVLERARAANSHVVCRASINHAETLESLGEIVRAQEVRVAGLEAARRFGSHTERWLLGTWLHGSYCVGDWSTAKETTAELLDRSDGGHYLDFMAHQVLASIAAAQGDDQVAGEHLRQLVERARDLGDPQVIRPALGIAARLSAERGERDAGLEYLAASTGALDFLKNADGDTVEAVLAAAILGHGRSIADVLAPLSDDIPWARAGVAIVEGRFADAADLVESCGDVTRAALIRLIEAEQAGHATPGLRSAVAFYRGVGAAAYLARAESLGLEETRPAST